MESSIPARLTRSGSVVLLRGKNTLPDLQRGKSLKHSNNLGDLNECETGERVCVRVCVKKEENGTRKRERG